MPLSSCGKTFLINLESSTESSNFAGRRGSRSAAAGSHTYTLTTPLAKMGVQWSCKTFFPAWDTANLEARMLTPSYLDPGDMNRLFPSLATRCSSLRTLSLGRMLELGHGGQVLPGIIF